MVRIISRLDQVKKEQKKLAKPTPDFEIGNIAGKVRDIIAAEEKEFKAGETKPVKIKKIDINANHICFISAYGTNKNGHNIAVGEETYLPISMERSADHALFAAALDYKVEKDDLLGILILLPAEVNF